MSLDVEAIDWMALERKVEHLRKDRTTLSPLFFDAKVHRLRKGGEEKIDFVKAWAQAFDLPVEVLIRDCRL